MNNHFIGCVCGHSAYLTLTDFTYKVNGKEIAVIHVPTYECPDCHETFIDAKTHVYVEELAFQAMLENKNEIVYRK